MADPRVVIGVDAGSASVRSGVFDLSGRRLAFAARPILQFHPAAGFVEQSSTDIWGSTCAAVREAMALAGVPAQSVAALGFDATCSLVAVGDAGAPVSVAVGGEPERDVIMWMDHRAGEEAAAINATGDAALAFVGGEVSLEMELPKVLWLRRHFPDRYARVWRFFDLADYLVWRACGADTASVCTLTCKWNYLAHEGRFPGAMLGAVGLRDLLPRLPSRVLPLAASPGHLTAAAAGALGLTTDVVVATGIIDAHAGGLALVGARPEGSLAMIGGTSTCHMLASPRPVKVPGVWGPYLGAMVPGYWLNEGGQSATGALLDWTVRQSDAWPLVEAAVARDGRSPYAVLNEWVAALRSREAHPTCDLHVLPDHHGNRSPRADPQARGAVTGLSLEGGPEALARLYLATAQALAYGTRHIVDALIAAGHRIERLVVCGGGAKNPLLLQEQADALGRDLELVEDQDPVALGAALLAATAGGAFGSLSAAAAAMVRPGGRVTARPSERAFHDAKYQVFLQLHGDQRRHLDRMAPWR
jgi:FGGY-family pentulose kinase